jgi:hypothetical protein
MLACLRHVSDWERSDPVLRLKAYQKTTGVRPELLAIAGQPNIFWFPAEGSIYVKTIVGEILWRHEPKESLV